MRYGNTFSSGVYWTVDRLNGLGLYDVALALSERLYAMEEARQSCVADLRERRVDGDLSTTGYNDDEVAPDV